MLIRPQTLSLITTHQCTAACDNCCFTCTPKITKAIPIDRMATLIDEAAAIPTMTVVVFTGGECFLLGSELDRLIARGISHGLVTRCVTNGYWAASSKAAERRVGRLADAGLIEINFSTGPMHAKYVPVQRIVRGAAACIAAGLTTLINVETYQDCDFDLATLIDHPDLRDSIRTGRLRVQRNVWINNAEGHGMANMTHVPENSRFRPERKSACKTVLNVIAVTPDQSLVACCGLHMESIPELHLGSVAQQSIQSVLANAPDDLLKIWMHLDGPEVILEFVKKHVPTYQLPLNCVHPCETCHKLYTDEVAQRVLRQHYPEIEKDVAERYLTSVAINELSAAAWHIRKYDAAALNLETAGATAA